MASRIAFVACWAAAMLVAAEQPCWAQPSPVCIPGTEWCAHQNADGSIQVGGKAHGQVNPNGANASASGNADARGNANAGASGPANDGGGNEPPDEHQHPPRRSGYSSAASDFGAGLALCATLKAGVYSGVKGGPCFAVSFRTEDIGFGSASCGARGRASRCPRAPRTANVAALP